MERHPRAAASGSDIERRRDKLEPFIAHYSDFEGARGLSVLEIGVGMATDFVRFACAGARMTGIDLTQATVGHARRRLALEGLQADLRVADAEALPFDDATFDRVHSWRALHHSPNTRQAVSEAIRVLMTGPVVHDDHLVILQGLRFQLGHAVR